MIKMLDLSFEKDELMTIKQASDWASLHLQRNVTPSNISYLVQYGRIKKIGDNGNTLVSKDDLATYPQDADPV
jgi:hypothetical protein